MAFGRTFPGHGGSRCLPEDAEDGGPAAVRVFRGGPRVMRIGVMARRQLRKWLARHPRFHQHFTPTGASWLNQIDRFFGLIADERIRLGNFTSVKDLKKAMHVYIEHHPKHFVWTATPEKIFDKLSEAFS